MKVLITSGGTKIKIDAVRSITNMSKGTFASHIANSFSSYDEITDVYFLMTKNSLKPKHNEEYFSSFHFIEYDTFDDYNRILFTLLDTVCFDVVVLAAAVSDYGVVDYVNGKIRSENELVIRLKPLPKLISKVRKHVGKSCVVCGFKLLVNSSEDELLEACENSIKKNDIDIVVGNDLADIKNNNHKLLILDKYGVLTKHSKYEEVEDTIITNDLPVIVVKRCLDIYSQLPLNKLKNLSGNLYGNS